MLLKQDLINSQCPRGLPVGSGLPMVTQSIGWVERMKSPGFLAGVARQDCHSHSFDIECSRDSARDFDPTSLGAGS